MPPAKSKKQKDPSTKETTTPPDNFKVSLAGGQQVRDWLQTQPAALDTSNQQKYTRRGNDLLKRVNDRTHWRDAEFESVVLSTPQQLTWDWNSKGREGVGDVSLIRTAYPLKAKERVPGDVTEVKVKNWIVWENSGDYMDMSRFRLEWQEGQRMFTSARSSVTEKKGVRWSYLRRSTHNVSLVPLSGPHAEREFPGYEVVENLTIVLREPTGSGDSQNPSGAPATSSASGSRGPGPGSPSSSRLPLGPPGGEALAQPAGPSSRPSRAGIHPGSPSSSYPGPSSSATGTSHASFGGGQPYMSSARPPPLASTGSNLSLSKPPPWREEGALAFDTPPDVSSPAVGGHAPLHGKINFDLRGSHELSGMMTEYINNDLLDTQQFFELHPTSHKFTRSKVVKVASIKLEDKTTRGDLRIATIQTARPALPSVYVPEGVTTAHPSGAHMIQTDAWKDDYRYRTRFELAQVRAALGTGVPIYSYTTSQPVRTATGVQLHQGSKAWGPYNVQETLELRFRPDEQPGTEHPALLNLDATRAPSSIPPQLGREHATYNPHQPTLAAPYNPHPPRLLAAPAPPMSQSTGTAPAFTMTFPLPDALSEMVYAYFPRYDHIETLDSTRYNDTSRPDPSDGQFEFTKNVFTRTAATGYVKEIVTHNGIPWMSAMFVMQVAVPISEQPTNPTEGTKGRPSSSNVILHPMQPDWKATYRSLKTLDMKLVPASKDDQGPSRIHYWRSPKPFRTTMRSAVSISYGTLDRRLWGPCTVGEFMEVRCQPQRPTSSLQGQGSSTSAAGSSRQPRCESPVTSALLRTTYQHSGVTAGVAAES